MHFNWRY